MILPVIAGVVAAGAGIAGAIGQRNDASRDASAQNRFNRLQAELTFQSQKRDRAVSIAQGRNELAFARAKAKQEIAVARATANQEWQFTNAVNRFNYIRERTNAELDWQYRTAAQNMDWQLQQTLQDAEYRAIIRAFEQSERTFADQLRLNSQAAGLAYESAQQQVRFSQVLSIIEADATRRDTAKQKGAVAASGRSGASMARLQLDAQQQYASDLGILATNLAFAKTDFNMNQSEAWLAQQSANSEAESRRMLRPMDKIDIPRPIDIPKAFIPEPPRMPKPIVNKIKPIVPKKIIKPPKPIRGAVPTARGPSALGTIGAIGSAVLGGVQTGVGLKASGVFG
jgi:hypothetical protein